MTIVKIIQSLDFGGIEKVFEVVAKYDLEHREQITFLVLGKGGAAEMYIRDLGYKVVVLGSPTKIPHWPLITRIYRFLRAGKPDVVHCTGAEGNFHGIIAAWLARVPVRVGEEIGMPAHSGMAKRVFRYVFRLSHKVIAVAGPVGEFLTDSGEVPPEKLAIIYNPVDVDTFLKKKDLTAETGTNGNAGIAPADISPLYNGRRIISVCRLHPIKNLATMIRAFSLAAGKFSAPLEYWIVGDGEERAILEKLVEALGLKDKIIFWGYKQDPAPYLSASHLFVLPSFSEGHPVSAIEAMLTGLPCMVTKVGGAPEFIEEGVNGWLIDPFDAGSIAEVLSRALQMKEEALLEMGVHGREKVLNRFRPEVYLEHLYSLYASVLPSNKK